MINYFKYSNSLNTRLVIIMLFLSFIMISALLIIYSRSEKALSAEIERQTSDLTKAIQIGVEEVTATGSSDEARLANYLNSLNMQGIKEISIISNADEIVASTIPSKIGQPVTHKRKELIIKAELGEPVSEEGSAYNVIVPVIAGNTQYGYIHLKVNKDNFTKMLQENTIKRITAAVIVFSIGIILTLILSKHYTKPIEQIAMAASRVAAGDLNQNINIRGNDEIAKMAQSFNHMVSKLKETKSLEERLREAEHLSGLGQLSRSIAHEIRNPLNFINLSIEHMETKYAPTEPQKLDKFKNLINGIKLEVQRLNKLVSDFLDYSRPMKLNKKPVNIKILLEDTLSLVWAKAEAEGILIKKEDFNDATLKIDLELFKSCLMNVIGNAFQAMSEPSIQKKELAIKTSIENDYFVITISDTGHGIAEENLERVFEPFFSTKQNGLGLGLSMTKRVIEEHNGRVEINSLQGVGTDVRLILPLMMSDLEPVKDDSKIITVQNKSDFS
ncbi:MAG: ATP-binding protein [Thermodesulfovibrionales bacterium]|nr:ATP-binding protein [Thermodesulfovibrionales bacterium]